MLILSRLLKFLRENPGPRLFVLCSFALLLVVNGFNLYLLTNSHFVYVNDKHLMISLSSAGFCLVLFILMCGFMLYHKALYYRDRVEERFHALLKLHTSNVSEFNSGYLLGRAVFVRFLQEFRMIHRIVKDVCNGRLISIKKTELIEIAYLCMYVGGSDGHARMLRDVLSEYDQGFVDELIAAIFYTLEECAENGEDNSNYFDGHEASLSHYFRNIYEIVRYIDNQHILMREEKESYLSLLCAQLSDHEQVFIFLHMTSRMSRPWLDRNLFFKYSTIKNLPKNFLCEQNEINVKTICPEVLFDWEVQLESHSSL